MSVKKSRSVSKTSAAKRQKQPVKSPVTNGQEESVQSTEPVEDAGKTTVAKDLSSRVSRKVAAEKAAATEQSGSDAAKSDAQGKPEGTGEVSILPSRRVWPD